MQKDSERVFVERTATLLGEDWRLDARESPDFIITFGEEKFGLEVCEVFLGSGNSKGSIRKQEEANRQRVVRRLQDAFERRSNDSLPLDVALVGDTGDENLEALSAELAHARFEDKPVGYQVRMEIDKGRRRLIAFAKRSVVPRWYDVANLVGWVSRDPKKKIETEIKKKSLKLNDYKVGTQVEDIRLLIVADRTRGSGMLLLEEPFSPDTKGFRRVYFLSYPDRISIFE
jgi:hypothetical protein